MSTRRSLDHAAFVDALNCVAAADRRNLRSYLHNTLAPNRLVKLQVTL